MPILFDRGPKLQLEEFRLIRDFINGFCGIYFADDALYVVERRLRERIQALGLLSFAQYYQYLRYHPDAAAEVERAVDELTTNETYFFREEYQLRAFAEEILPELRNRLGQSGSKKLGIWSAGCSTGEEVYTLAILVLESGLFEGWDVRVLGSDISKRVLHKARRAVYGPSSFRTMPKRYENYFLETREGLQVHPRVRALSHFAHLNLLDRGRSAIVGKVDAILCRNVLIYFDQASRRRVLENFHERLNPGGYLLLGHSESLLNATTAFELCHLATDLVYRRSKTTTPFGRGNP